ncbi:hypothetical protein NL494_27560, partial [Klebsiella pneumoniae]|nr:hypothetical protein [Klebsiella pneumoniae]
RKGHGDLLCGAGAEGRVERQFPLAIGRVPDLPVGAGTLLPQGKRRHRRHPTSSHPPMPWLTCGSCEE